MADLGAISCPVDAEGIVPDSDVETNENGGAQRKGLDKSALGVHVLTTDGNLIDMKDKSRLGSQQGTATSSSAEATKQQDNQGLQHFDNDTDTDEEDEVNSEKKDREVEPNSADSEDFLAEFPDETDDLELVHLKLDKIANLNLPRFARHLKRLCLRQNNISVLDPEIFEQLTSLEELDLYDNKVKHVKVLESLKNLSVLDLSFNLLRAIPNGMEHLQSLHTVYFVQNKISTISGLQASMTLRSLELGSNRVRKIEGLDALVNLEELWLGKNKISRLEGLNNLKKLKILAAQSNRLTKLEKLEDLENLEQLYVSHNGIKKLEGLEKNLKLSTLDVSSNFIPAIENISHLKDLEELWMSGNQIPDLRGLEAELKQISSLKTIYLEYNPCQTTDLANYRRKIILALPQVVQIDATYVRMP